jgi:hypothetical protein
MRESSVRVAIATPTSGISSTSAARPSTLPKDQSGERCENDAGGDVDESVDEHRDVLDVVAECVIASPAEPTGWPASGPPLATWAISKLARSSDCMCTHARVHISAPR